MNSVEERLSHLDAQIAGMKTQADGGFASDDGTMRLVLVQPAGQSLRCAASSTTDCSRS